MVTYDPKGVPSLREQKTLCGHDAHCHICWNPVFVLWADVEAPNYSKCPYGDHDALTCPDANARAKSMSIRSQLRRDGLLYKDDIQ